MIRTVLCVMFAAAWSPAMVSAETTLSHSPTYTEGETIQTEVEMEIDQNLTINGMAIETEVNNFVVIKETVKDPSPGSVKMKGEMEKMQMDMSLPGGLSLNFDSSSPNNPAPAGPLGDIMKYIEIVSKATWSVEYGQDGKVKSAKYDLDTNQIPEMYQSEMTEDRLVKETNTGIDRLPKNPVSKGDSWERNEEAYLGNGQVFYLVRQYTYLGSEDHNDQPMEKIDVKTKSLTFEIEGGNLPLELKESNLSVKSSSGTLWYNPKLKQVTESVEETRFVGDLTFVAGGQELPSELDLTLKVKTNVKR